MGRADHSYEVDAFCLPKDPSLTVALAGNCRAMVLSWTLRPGVRLADVTLETLSQDVVIGLMGVSLMNPRRQSKNQDVEEEKSFNHGCPSGASGFQPDASAKRGENVGWTAQIKPEKR